MVLRPAGLADDRIHVPDNFPHVSVSLQNGAKRGFGTMPDMGEDPAFRSLSKNVPCFLLWRVDNLQLIPVPKDQYGTFYDADSYILYAASEPGKFITADAKGGGGKGGSRAEAHVHAWLGSESPAEERAIAMYKACSLARTLLSPAALHREPMGHESPRFRAYFDHIRLLRGSASDGNAREEARLVRITGRRRAVARQTPSLDRAYLSPRGVYLLDTRDVVFVWFGRDADPMEKLQAIKIAMKLRDEHKAVSIVFVDQGKEHMLHSSEQLLLGVYLRSPDQRSIQEAQMDEDIEPRMDVDSKPHLKLYRCSDTDGVYKVVEVKSGPPLHRADLESNGCYILDNWWECVWVWVGRQASAREQDEALGNAQGFVRKKRYPDGSTRLARVIEGAEPHEFIALFASWPATNNNTVTAVRQEGLEAGPSVVYRMNPPPSAMHNKTNLMPTKSHGPTILYSAEAYLINYTLPGPNQTSVEVSTHWFGEECDMDEDGGGRRAWAEGTGNTVVALAAGGCEPAHLLAALNGHLVVLSGNFKDKMPDRFLLKVTGNAPHTTTANQVPLCGSSLEPRGVFVYVSFGVVQWVWCGRGSTGDQREMAKSIATAFSSSVEYAVVFQGQEKDDFWECLGGKSGVNFDMTRGDSMMSINSIDMKMPCPKYNADRLPRLFQISPQSNSIKVDEVINYSQADLISEDVMLMDTCKMIFLWIGQKAKYEEKTKALYLAMEYLKLDVSGRDSKTPIMQINEGHEPLLFTQLFSRWDPHFTKEIESYETLRETLERDKPLLQVELEQRPQTDFDSADKFPITTLMQRDPSKLPLSIDLLHKECHLSTNDFLKVFGMGYEEFTKLPRWRQVSLKKQVGLF